MRETKETSDTEAAAKMVFWGVELKPGVPTRISFKGQTNKILRITQATLGSGADYQQVYVYCKVAGFTDQIRILCMVSPRNDSCTMDLAFEPSDEAELVVHGLRSVHVAGYYTPTHHCSSSQLSGGDLGVNDTKEEELDGNTDNKVGVTGGDDDPTLASPRSPDQCTREVVDKSEGRVKKRKQVGDCDAEKRFKGVRQRLF